jgi:uncharacterized membrane protein
MAGIGFRLQKILSENTYTATLKAYAFSSLIAAGPFLLTVLVVSMIHWVSGGTMSRAELFYFQAVTTYAFMFSLVTIGATQLVLTRFVADEYYRGHIGSMTAAFFSALLLHCAVWGPAALYFVSGLSTPWSVRIGALLLYFCVSGTWLAILFLSAAKDYLRISTIFVAGAAASFAAAALFGDRFGLAGYLNGFTLGQGAILLLLGRAIIKEFGYRESRNYYWLRYFRKYPYLIGIGILYNLAIWIDKLVFWTSTHGESLDAGLRHTPVYDAPMFFSYLTIVPSMAYFLVRMETDFFNKYHAYYTGIEEQESLPRLEKRRVAIVESLRHSFERLILLQGIVSGASLLLVPWIVEVSRMDPLQMGILRTGIFAAFLQAGVLIGVNVLLYFDFQKEAFVTAAVFCAANGILTRLSTGLGLPAFGFGYTVACLCSLGVAVYYMNVRVDLLHYWTFMRQPVPTPVIVPDEGEEIEIGV